jgi:hypothetical protein
VKNWKKLDESVAFSGRGFVPNAKLYAAFLGAKPVAIQLKLLASDDLRQL